MLLVLTLACFVTVEAQQRRDGARLQAPDVCWVAGGGQNSRFRVNDLSITGVAFHGESPVPCESTVTVSVDNLDVAGRVVRASAGSFAVRFVHNEQSRMHLIRYVYSGRYKATTEDIKTGWSRGWHIVETLSLGRRLGLIGRSQVATGPTQ